MNILVWTGCWGGFFLSCVLAKFTEPTERTYKYDPIFGHRIDNTISKESNKSRERRYFFRKKYLDTIREIKPELHRFKDELTFSEQISLRPLDPNSCRKEYVRSKNYTRRSILPEYLMCDSQFKEYGEDVEKAALASLEKRFEREKKGREEKQALERRKKEELEGRLRTTIHPMFRRRKTIPTSTKENSKEVFTASSRILHELESKQNKIYTGDSAHYEKMYEDLYGDLPTEESKSISSGYASFERWYDERIRNPNRTTPHYEWWTYNPNETCERYEGVPLDYNRVLYSLKMSSILPANISEEVEAMYNRPNYMDTAEANRLKKSLEDFGKSGLDQYNSNCGPIPERRELHKPQEIIENRYYDVEEKFGKNLQKDVDNYFKKPIKKGLYHFKHWINKNFTTTTRKPALTWPEQDINSHQMVEMYKRYLKEEKNITVRDSAGHSIFRKEQYRFTADSNYYGESLEDLPWATKNPY